MSITTQDCPDGARNLIIEGECDLSNSDQLRNALMDTLRNAPDRISVNLEAVEFFDCTAISALADAANHHYPKRITIAASGPLVRLFQLVKLDDLVDLDLSGHPSATRPQDPAREPGDRAARGPGASPSR